MVAEDRDEINQEGEDEAGKLELGEKKILLPKLTRLSSKYQSIFPVNQPAGEMTLQLSGQRSFSSSNAGDNTFVEQVPCKIYMN